MKKLTIFLLISLLTTLLLFASCRPKNTNDTNDTNDIINSEQENENNDQDNEDEENVSNGEDLDNNENASEEENIIYYINKLKDKSFVSEYGDVNEPSIWYTAAEELGKIGKSAIPYLINNLSTNDSYEKGLTLYALLLASQDEELMQETNKDYINAGLTFTSEEQEKYTQNALIWWDKYKSFF